MASLAALVAGCAADAHPPGVPGLGSPPGDVQETEPPPASPVDPGEGAAATPGPPPPLCAHIDLAVERQHPTVLFVVDRSGSMRGGFHGDPETSRWGALRAALFGADHDDEGVVTRQAPAVRFGLALYTSMGLPPDSACPVLVEHAPALAQATDLEASFDAAPPAMNGKTPTGDALDALLTELEASPPTSDGPTVLVLATDGDPDTCADPSSKDAPAREHAVRAVTRARDQLGISTYVLALGQVRADHLQDLANAGIGRAADAQDPAPYWTPTDTDGLEGALAEIVGGTLDCALEVDGRLDQDRVCEGVMRLDGQAVPCDATGGGFRASSPSTIELLGDTCARFRSGRVTEVVADFPCDVILR